MDRQWQVAPLLAFVAAVAAVGLVLLTGDSGDSGGSGDSGAYTARIDPAEFTTEVDNAFFPLRPGTRRVYEATRDDGKAERTVVEVTSDTRRVMGVECVVVRDTVSVGGEVIEDTFDWYAQDAKGNVWYFGEDTKEYENGKVVSTEGAWEAGVDGAQPGIVMKAKAQVGDRYRQEYYRGKAEDMGEVLGLDERVLGLLGPFDGVLKTKDYTPLEPGVVEHKYYAKGVGVILEVTVEGGSGATELVEMTPPLNGSGHQRA